MKYNANNIRSTTKLSNELDSLIAPNGQKIHTEDVQDIIGSPPGSLVRWGTSWVFVVFVAIVVLAAFIRYPDIVQAPIRINAANAPKVVIAKLPGNLINILAKESDTVSAGQPLAWIESTADHGHVIALLGQLHKLRDSLLQRSDALLTTIGTPAGVRLGELQGSYQAFYQSYITYRSATGDGIYLKQRVYLLRDIDNVKRQRAQLEKQQLLQREEYALAEAEFDRYQVLASRKVISPAEYQEARAKLLASKHPLEQAESVLLSNEASHRAKVKELADLDNQIIEEKSKFMQALNSLISEMEQWKMQFVLTASQQGTLVYAGVIQPGQYVDAGQEVFYINPGSTEFFGEANIPQYNMGKVKDGQDVLVKLDSYPFEEYGVIKGRVEHLNRVPYQDSIFLARVDLLPRMGKFGSPIELRTGMLGRAEIVTEDASLLQRLMRNIKLALDNGNR